MSHPDSVQVHDHAYGFRSSAHVPSCPDCRRAAESVEAERDALRGALSGESSEAPPESLFLRLAVSKRRRERPAASSPLSTAGVAAGILFLLALGGLLFIGRASVRSTASAQAPDPLDRLIAELKSPSSERRAAAQAILPHFGAVAAERLKREGLDPALAEAAPAAAPEDARIEDLLRSRRVTIDLQNGTLPEIIKHLEKESGLRFVIDRKSIPNPEEEQVSFRVSDIVMDGALKLMLFPREKRHVVRGGIVFVTGMDVPAILGPARAPVRVLRDAPEAKGLVQALASGDPKERDAAESSIRLLGFGAEPALWEALDSGDAEVRSRAGRLLRRVYTPNPVLAASPLAEKLRGAIVAAPGAKLGPYLEVLARETGIPFVLDPGRVSPSLDVGSPARVSLRPALEFVKLKAVLLDDLVLVARESEPILRSAWNGPVWIEPAEARRLEALIEGLASTDPARQEKAHDGLLQTGLPATEPLREAARLLEPAAAARCRAARRRILDREGAWIVDEPSGAELQALSAAQRAILDRVLPDSPTGLPLARLLDHHGIPHRIGVKLEAPVHAFTRELKAESLLKILTRPSGLDFYMDGETVVVDTAARVRAAVEK
jgi:hypothetical protein